MAASDGKRLCERWLDHLFMALYEDLKAYTVVLVRRGARTRQRAHRHRG